MGAAVAVQEYESAERPGWSERILVLGVCAGLLLGLAILDERAAERERARAHEVIAERAQRAAERSSREAMTAPVAASAPRTERLGRQASLVIVAGAFRTGAVVPATEREPRRASAPPSLPAAAGGSRGDDPLLLMLMAALGLSLAGGGLRLLSRRSA